MTRIVIIGAGLTGLSTAYHLEKQGFTDYKLFEMNSSPGGLCRTVTHKQFSFDYTGHLLHINDDYFKQFLDTILPKSSLLSHTRQSYIFSHEIYTPYPFQKYLHGLPKKVISDCIRGFAHRTRTIENPVTFYEWVLKYFGKGFGEHFFFPYNTKLFATNAKWTHPSWTGRFVPQVKMQEIIRGAFQKPKNDMVGYNSSFVYPKSGGIQSLVTGIAEKIQNPIYFNAQVTSIDATKKVVTFSNGHHEHYDKLITTMPLNQLVLIIKKAPRYAFHNAAKKLLCNSVMNFNLGFNIPNISEKHWVYLPEKQYIPYRFGFWQNFSQTMTPPNCSAIYGETSYLPIGTTVQQKQNLIKKSIDQVCKILKVEPKQIVAKKILHIPHAYVIYDQWRHTYLSRLHSALGEFSISSIGRYGGWQYSSMQEAILDGKKNAEAILEKPFISSSYPAIKTITAQKE